MTEWGNPSDVLNFDDDLLHIFRRDIEMIRKLFNFESPTKSDIENLTKDFKNYIAESENGPYYFAMLLDYFSKMRPKLQSVCFPLKDCILEQFPSHKEHLFRFMLHATTSLRHCFNDEERAVFDSSDDGKLVSILQNDDIDGFIQFLANHPLINLNEEIKFSQYCFAPSPMLLIDYSAYYGSPLCFKYLFLNSEINKYSTIRMAIAGGNKEIISILQQKGYSFNYCLDMSILGHRYELMDWLWENFPCGKVNLAPVIETFNFQAFVYFLRNGEYCESRKEELENSIQSAAFIGHIPLFKFIVNEGINIDEKDIDGRMPIHLAAKQGHLDLLKYIYNQDNSLARKKDNSKIAPVHLASNFGHLPIVKFLHEVAGAEIEIKDNRGKTPFYDACLNDHIPLFLYLLEKGVDFNVLNNLGESPLHAACKKGNIKIIQHLLDLGSNINIKDKAGQTPLHIACQFGKLSVVKLLVDKGANMECKDKRKKTPICIAAKEQKNDIVQYLISKGADKTRIEKKNF